jgi:hypothetical protein
MSIRWWPFAAAILCGVAALIELGRGLTGDDRFDIFNAVALGLFATIAFAHDRVARGWRVIGRLDEAHYVVRSMREAQARGISPGDWLTGYHEHVLMMASGHVVTIFETEEEP